MKEEDSLLPALPDEEISLSNIKQPTIQEFPHNVALPSVRKEDLEIATMGLRVVSEMWKHANSFARVMRLQKETRDAVKFRREVLGLPYGTQNSGTKGDDLNPIET